ncbi:translation initiation factor IF-3 [Ureaplasma ceti]|uniref:Translation initiation factor IF-3 n=1 Tax=Ureaplasma ceti TaxID=3119530 RepID=A0ABP9U502_9BACT
MNPQTNNSRQSTAPTNNQNQPRKDTVLINDKIKYRELLVIDENGEQLGILPRKDALQIARDKDLDLVVIAAQKDKVIAKILDYSKFKFEQKKKQKENRKNQQVVKVKEVKVKPLIGDHDLNVKAENSKKWLQAGDKVKFIIEARGRMSTKVELVQEIYDKFIAMLDNNGKVQQANKKVSYSRYETIIEPNK